MNQAGLEPACVGPSPTSMARGHSAPGPAPGTDSLADPLLTSSTSTVASVAKARFVNPRPRRRNWLCRDSSRIRLHDLCQAGSRGIEPRLPGLANHPYVP